MSWDSSFFFLSLPLACIPKSKKALISGLLPQCLPQPLTAKGSYMPGSSL